MKSEKRSWRQKTMIGLIVVIGAWVIFAVWLFATAWYRVPGYKPKASSSAITRILTSDEYGELLKTHDRPYIYTIERPGSGRVVVFGAEHTKNPDDPQLEMIHAEWHEVRPTAALIESDLGMLFPSFMDPVVTFGEVGEVHRLARVDGIPTYSWDPSDERVIQSVLDQGFTRQRVALRWLLGPSFSNLRHGRPADPESLVLDTLSERGNTEGIRGALTSMDEINAAWNHEFPHGPDWRDVSDQFGLPGFLGEMDLNRVRDEHLVASIEELIEAGESVFVICGSSHAVKIEPALRSIVD